MYCYTWSELLFWVYWFLLVSLNPMGASDCYLVNSLIRIVERKEHQHYKIQKHAPGN